MGGDAPETWQIVLGALRARPAGLLTDVDGVISRIAPTPDEARVAPEASAALERLAQKVQVVAAISGRAAPNILGMVGVPAMTYVGNHGLEEVVDEQVRLVPEAQPYEGKVPALLADAGRQLALEGVLVEDKGITGSVHYRRSTDPEGSRRAILAVLEPLVERAGLTIHEGRMVIEIRPPVKLGKGAAARRLVERHGLRGCVFLGDDVTDLDAFRALRELAGEGVRTACVGVVSAEAPPGILEESDLTVEGVDGVVELLSWLDRKL